MSTTQPDHTRPTAAATSVEGAGVYLGVSSKTIRRLIAEGRLHAFRVRGHNSTRVRYLDLDALMEPTAPTKPKRRPASAREVSAPAVRAQARPRPQAPPITATSPPTPRSK